MLLVLVGIMCVYSMVLLGLGLFEVIDCGNLNVLLVVVVVGSGVLEFGKVFGSGWMGVLVLLLLL